MTKKQVKNVVMVKEITSVVVNEIYVLVLWPESQEYMDKTWFASEAVLCNPDLGHRLQEESSAYFIPIKYINKKIKFIWE